MKAHIDIQHEGTISAEGRVRMTFDENSITHLMSVLTDLYSDPALAVIREYSTNGYDAHRAAGNPAPIEISTPNSFNPIFVVKDYGTGMSVDEICQQFSKYGWSSKRDTDNEVGMLGLGCKSALTYTSQFTLVSIKDGVKATVLVTREDDGTGAVQIMDTASTTEPNGVEVRVPVKQVELFKSKIRKFFQFWDKGTVLVDGAEPESIYTDPATKKLDEDIYIATGLDADYVVMGQVAYPVDRSKKPLVPGYSNSHAVIRVEIGSINFTPSREALHYTKRTEEVLDTARQFINERLFLQAQQEVDALPTHGEALKVAQTWRRSFSGMVKLKYRGEAIPQSFNFTKEVALENGDPREYPPFEWPMGWIDRAACACHLISAESLDKYLFVVGHKGTGVPRRMKRQLVEYKKANGIKQPSALLCAEMPNTPWLDGVTRVDAATIRAIKLPDDPNEERTPSEPVIRHLVRGGYIRTTTDKSVLANPHLMYVEVQTLKNFERWASALGEWVDESKVFCVVLNANQVNKFKRENPAAVEVRDALRAAFDKLKASLTPEECFILHCAKEADSIGVRLIEPEKVLDPEFRDVLLRFRSAKKSGKQHQWNVLTRLLGGFGQRYTEPGASSFLAEVRQQAAKYPLLEITVQSYGPAAYKQYLVEYINATYLVRNHVRFL